MFNLNKDIKKKYKIIKNIVIIIFVHIINFCMKIKMKIKILLMNKN